MQASSVGLTQIERNAPTDDAEQCRANKTRERAPRSDRTLRPAPTIETPMDVRKNVERDRERHRESIAGDRGPVVGRESRIAHTYVNAIVRSIARHRNRGARSIDPGRERSMRKRTLTWGWAQSRVSDRDRRRRGETTDAAL